MRAALLLLPLLAACSPTLPTKVLVEVPVACIKSTDMPVRPPLVKDTELRAASRGERTFAMKRYQDLADPYMAEMESALRRCSTPP